MKKLVDFAVHSEFIGRGRIIKFPGDQIIHEKWLNVMVYDCSKEGFGMGLLVVSGHKSGLTLQILPEESQGKGRGVINTAWLTANFNKWVYEEVDIDKVYVCDRPDAAGGPNDDTTVEE